MVQSKLLEYCRSKGIAVTAYSPLGSPDSPFRKPDEPQLLDDPKLIELGKKYGKSVAQIVLRWQVNDTSNQLLTPGQNYK